MRKKVLIILLIVGFPLLLGFVGEAIRGWGVVFDDAFISYRYAENLADGYGLTWNRGMAPTEGYTNFLLVIILSFFIRIGLHPLLMTRLLSYLCVLFTALLFFTVARRQYKASVPTAFLVSTLAFLISGTRQLCLVGLETVIYSFFLLMTFHIAVRFIVSNTVKYSVLSGVLAILTMLLRPEAAMLYVAMVFVYLFHSGLVRRNSFFKSSWPLLLGMLVLMCLGFSYVLWKYFYFGELLPNPFYIKAVHGSVISTMGCASVRSFLHAHRVILFTFIFGVFFCCTRFCRDSATVRTASFLGMVLFGLNIIFFCMVDTMMDIHGRFLFPMSVVLAYCCIPFLVRVISRIEQIVPEQSLVYAALPVLWILIFSSQDILHIRDSLKTLTSGESKEVDGSLMQVEYRVARSLADFPDIRDVRIAFGDAGVIPFFTGALWLDPVGLNDGFIARTRDKEKLVSHFFEFEPDLIIHPGEKDFSWITYGHGPLGDYASWSGDPRWDEYEYIGTCKTGLYDLQFLVKISGRYYRGLKTYIQNRVADGKYDIFPYPLGAGGSSSTNDLNVKWISFL